MHFNDGCCIDASREKIYLLGNVFDDTLFGVAPHDDGLQGFQLGQRLEQEFDLVLVDKADACL